MDKKHGADARAVVALLLVQLFFAVSAVIGKIAMKEVTPLVLASFRAVFGALGLALAERLLVKERAPLTARERGTLLLLSVLGVVANQTLFLTGLGKTTATNATLLVTTIPIFTLVFAMLARVEKPRLRRLLGVPVALSGVLLLVDWSHVSFGTGTGAGDLFIVANCLSYSLYLVLARDILSRRPAITVTSAIFVYGALPILLLSASDLRRFDPRPLSTGAWLSIACVVVFGTILAYFLNAWALARVSASTSAVFIYVQPLVGGLLAWPVLHERPGARVLAAGAVIFLGVALTTVPERR